MASISQRRDCKKDSWRVQIRQNDVPPLSLSFKTYEEAKEWVDSNEQQYLNNPIPYRFMKNNTKEPSSIENNPHKHPLFPLMLQGFRRITERYFMRNDLTPEDISQATQEIYKESLKYTNENKE